MRISLSEEQARLIERILWGIITGETWLLGVLAMSLITGREITLSIFDAPLAAGVVTALWWRPVQ